MRFDQALTITKTGGVTLGGSSAPVTVMITGFGVIEASLRRRQPKLQTAG